MKVVVPVSLDSEKDADIVQWLAQHRNKSAAIRAVIRAQLQGGVTLFDIYRELQALSHRGVALAAPDQPEAPDDEPPEAAANLNKLLGG